VDAVLRVASYNVRGLADDVDAAVRVVRGLAPDVLCLQEIPRRFLFGHRVADFAAACGLYWPGGSRGSGGTTVMTSLRVETLAVGHEGLPVAYFDQQRGFGWQRVRLPGHGVACVVSIHLSLRTRERKGHVARVLERVPHDAPLVVAGDLNEEPSGGAWHALASRLRLVSPEGPTFPSLEPRKRIDAIFADPGLEVADPASRPLVHLDPGDLVAATDHLPVWTDLDLSAAR
jgi:endonuclease/exonuclease/phosphatase family metal-dependent hydrolase